MSDNKEEKVYLYEYSLSTDKYDRPSIFTNKRALAALVVRLFLLDPGTLQNNPECGIGLKTRWSYITEDQLDDFNAEATDQLTKYLGNEVNRVECKAAFLPNDVHILIINVEVGEFNIVLSYNKEEKTLSAMKE